MDSKTFLSSVLETIQQLQAARNADSVDVAYLGNALRKEGRNWESHGFERLSAALAQLQQEKLVETVRSEKGALRVRAKSASAAPLVSGSLSSTLQGPALVSRNEATRFRPLRPPVWFAFAASLPDGQERRINRRTGTVWSGATAPPGSSLDWVPVVPVPEADQRRWAHDFVNGSDITGDKESLTQSIDGDDWFRRFPVELEKHGPLLVRAWSHLRSNRIIDHVRAWAKQSNVAEDVLFAAERFLGKHQPVASESSRELSDVRQALLAAVAKMTTDDLLALRLPARLVIEVVRPDLLR